MASYYAEKNNVTGGIVEIANPGRYLRAASGFLVIEDQESRSELSKIDFDRFDCVIFSNPQFIISGPLLHILASRNKSVIVCGNDYSPSCMLMPVNINGESIKRIQSQISASLPLKKRLWQKIVQEKLKNQSMLLAMLGKDKIAKKLKLLAQRVRSGDSDNREAAGARLYWQALFEQFHRSDENDVRNHYLNYGYAVLRSAFCRGIAGTGLLPMFGLHHFNQRNYFALADDLMEPFRIMADLLAYTLHKAGKTQLGSEEKRSICKILVLDVRYVDETTPLTNAIQKTVISLVNSLITKNSALCFPDLLANLDPDSILA
ncbi:MAG: type II CRISPR-associated endonuclease Cas1 [Rectinema sp.]|nr:type II CRISPR-associated endonuclease Cas1 [Rectinema sp.]